jgi:phage terminase small subunit
MPRRREPGLSDAHRLFVAEYLVCRNATRAYLKVYPEATYETAKVEGCRLLTKPNVRAEVKAATAALSRHARVSAERVVRAAALVAFADPLDLFEFDADGNARVRTLREMPAELRRAIASIKVKRVTGVPKRGKKGSQAAETVEVIEYKLNDRVAAINLLMKHLGLFEKDNRQKAVGTPADAAERLKAYGVDLDAITSPSAN